MRDLSDLLDPIPGDDPAGADLRYDPVYDRIRELRREDDPNASRGIWTTRLKVADWSGVIETAFETLAERTKDLQVAAWLVEALAARNGLLGTAAGLDLLRALSERYWDVLWPRPEEDDDLDARLAPLVWVDARLAERVMMVPIAADGDPIPCWHDYISAQRAALAARTAKKKGRDTDTPEADMERMAADIAATGGEFFARLHAEIRLASDALTGLRTALDSACGGDGPSFSRLTQTLGSLEGFVRAECLSRGVAVDLPSTMTPPSPVEEALMSDVMAEADAQAGGEATELGLAAPPANAPPADGVVRSRDDAYRMLVEIARFLERTEPHSPVPHLLRRAIAWGRMSLPELLQELMSDQGNVFQLLGIDRAGAGAGARPPGRTK